MNWLERARNLVPWIKEEGEQGDQVKNFKPVWIVKPIGKSQGRGIYVVDDARAFLPTETPSVVQEYIARPLLIAGHKFDLRIYVCVASAFPLTIYVYKEGLTRFATEKYDLRNLGNVCSHLTNVSLNKLSPEYEKDKDMIGLGCKWSFQRLREYLKLNNHDDWYMWQRIISIIVLTLIGEANRGGFVPHTKNCFEFLGYDGKG
jgi:tubulin polyglutamylase TTLL2